jgi:hypothetical protein
VGEPEVERKRVETAKEVLRKLFSAFSSQRDERKGVAYRQLQRDLSAHADVLITSGQITLPQMIDTLQKLEEYLGSSGEHDDMGQDAATRVMQWLRGEDSGDDFEKEVNAN